MNILITGAAGFVGKNLAASLANIRDAKDRTHPNLSVDSLYLYDTDTSPELFEEACSHADFIFHLAGVNRTQDPQEFMRGNYGFSAVLTETLKKCGNCCPVVFASSIQATRIGRYDSEYGRSK